MSVRRHLLAVIRREVKRFAAIADDRAVQAQGACVAPGFRPLTESETEAILGGELLTSLTDVITS